MQLSLLNRKRLLMSVLVVFATACMQLSYARDISVPESLKPWEDWVSERHEELGCPIEATKGSQLSCGWFNKLVVHVSLDRPNHSSFRLHGEAFSETSIGLPHTSSRRPHDVRLNGRPALLGVRANGSTPIVHVTTGAYVIEGKLAFETLPSYINVPKQLSIVQLIVDEEVVSQPRFEDGQLWLTERTIDERSPVQNTLNIAVFRKLTDSVPQRLVTRLKLAASGQPRTVNIGKVIPDGFIVTQIRSDNPLQLNEDDSFLVKVAPGSSRIEIESQNYTVQNEFTFSSSAESWPNSEIWAFASVNNHRIVSVDGVQAVEPTIVYSPYTEVANYRLPTGDTLSLVDERRGNLHPGSVALDLHREIWLAFDGSTFRVKENLNVESTKDQRIEAHHPLGSLKVNGFVTMITQLSEKSESNGVNLVETNSEIETISDLGPDRTISAVGWNRDAESLSMVLNLPPGWLLLHASGVDVVKDSWLSRWGNLWDIFLCVLVIVVMYKIGGPLLATITGIALLLGYQEQWYTAVGWLVLGLLCLLTRTLGSDKLRITQLTIYWLVLVPVIVATLFVSVTNVRQAFYTQLETPYEQVRPHVSFSGERTSTIARKTLDVESPEIEALVVSGNFLEPDESVNDDLRYPILQTGTALPDWSWRTINLDWSGSVSEHHTLDLILSPPLLTKAVYLLIALLHLIILVFFIVVQVGRNWRWPPLALQSSAVFSTEFCDAKRKC